jgi:hypothetical protein
MNNKPDRRNFNRFPIEFVMEVAAKDREGNMYGEKAILKNVSGGGAKFISQQAEGYLPGQPLEMTVYLPGTNKMKACMRGAATV